MYVTLGRHHWEEGSVSSSPRSPCAPLQPVTPCPGHPDLLLSRHACSFWNHTCSPPSSCAWIPSHRPRVASEIQHVVALLLGVARLQPIVRACHALSSHSPEEGRVGSSSLWVLRIKLLLRSRICAQDSPWSRLISLSPVSGLGLLARVLSVTL